MVKKIISDYKEKHPDIGFFLMTKIFGLSFKEILNMLSVDNYEYFEGKGFCLYDEKGRLIYHEKVNGEWTKYEFNGDELTITNNKTE